MILNRRGFIGAGALALAGTARADAFPSKQIRWVIPFAPGFYLLWRNSYRNHGGRAEPPSP